MRAGTFVAALVMVSMIPAAPAHADPQEAKLGSKVYNWLAGQGKIVEQSPLYDILNPIANPLKAVADPRYDAPFVFTLGRDPYANVASVPGGRIYVSEKTFDVIQYREELAGALCHAVAHVVRHDYAALVRKNANAQLSGAALAIGLMAGSWSTTPFANLWQLGTGDVSSITGPAAVGGVLSTAASLAAAAKAERGADEMGADLCAEAGLNPWGLVWLLQNYKKANFGGRMEMLSNDASDRVRNLEAYFANAPDRFARFDGDRAHGTPLR